MPELDAISLAEATERLETAFASLPELHAAAPALASIARARAGGEPQWTLALDEIEDDGVERRTLMGLPGNAAGKRSLTKLPAA